MQNNIAIIHPYLTVRGGAEEVAFSIMRILLQEGNSIVVYVAENPLRARKIILKVLGPENTKHIKVCSPIHSALRCAIEKKRLVALGYAFLLRAMRKMDLSHYKFVLSTAGECDIVEGQRQACYIHFPLLPVLHTNAAQAGGRLSKNPLIKKIYTRLVLAISKFTQLPAGSLVMTNSNWTKSQIATLTGYTEVEVVYPPVVPFPTPVKQKPALSNGLICVVLGRLEPYKGHDCIINGLHDAAKEANSKATVRFVGRGKSEDEVKIKKMATDYVDVHVFRDATSAEVGNAIATSHVGASAFEFEHFGMATAELMASGLPVFVPNSGGQVEISDDPRFIFSSQSEMKQKFLDLMQYRVCLSDLQVVAKKRGNLFAGDKFAMSLRATLTSWLGE